MRVITITIKFWNSKEVILLNLRQEKEFFLWLCPLAASVAPDTQNILY